MPSDSGGSAHPAQVAVVVFEAVTACEDRSVTAFVKQLIHKSLEKLGFQICRTKNILFFPEDTFMRAYLVKAAASIPGGIRTVFDVGANVGNFSRFALSVFPQARVWAFEPITSTYEVLRKNVGGQAISHLEQ